MKRIEIFLNKEYRIIMRSSTATQMTNIKNEIKKQLNSFKPLSSTLGFDIGEIVWMGKSESITVNHTNNFLKISNSYGLWNNYLQEIDNPEYIVILKESSFKQIIVENIVKQRNTIYGSNDDIKRSYGNLVDYYSDWSLLDLNAYTNNLKKQIHI